MKTICGIDCNECYMKNECDGCLNTDGHPFGGICVIADCCHDKNGEYKRIISEYEKKLINEFNNLGIKDMPTVTSLNPLKGSFVNLEYKLSNNCKVKFWEDNNIYLGNQLPKKNSNKCFGLTADDNYLLVCEYGKDGIAPEIIIFKKR